jgi:hypothetical protein
VTGRLELEGAGVAAVESLHRFFEAWLAGRIDDAPAALVPVEEALSPDFTIVTPAGRRLEVAPLLAYLIESRGKRGASFRIEIRGARARVITPDVVIVSYEEWQMEDATWTGWSSTAVLRSRGGGRPLVWESVHETSLPSPQSERRS